MDIFNIIKKPLLTEKNDKLTALGKYIFIVDPKSNKNHIKKAVEKIFNVNVKYVNISNYYGKVKVFKGKKGRRSSFKKAIVTTDNMKKIEFSRGI